MSDQNPNVIWHSNNLSKEERHASLGYVGATIWFTGLSGSGKSSIASATEKLIVTSGRPSYLLDGDNLRLGLNEDLNFSAEDRHENVRRVAEVARLFADAGLVALVPLISPYRDDRENAREIHDRFGLRFFEVFVDTPIGVCEERDPKGLYKKARSGEIKGFTGIDDPYEKPSSPDLILTPEHGSPEDGARLVLKLLEISY
ncbi:MAG: adenylyl-sulfate kinase [Acidimicrobiaceae bacterium]|mgnify:FL=1|nr:adenylyl-sulfate kinase [Acidimicrobiaceae bacterium]